MVKLISSSERINWWEKISFQRFRLLIIDEEHKFGVNVKDKLKTLKANIDTLTLTATPFRERFSFL